MPVFATLRYFLQLLRIIKRIINLNFGREKKHISLVRNLTFEFTTLEEKYQIKGKNVYLNHDSTISG